MVERYFADLCDTFDNIDWESIRKIAKMIADCRGNVFVFGNGGSAATASHFAQDMNKCLDYRFICLNDNIASVLAYGNDIDFASIFKLQLAKLIHPGDLVIGFSCSGNSQNVIEAIKYAENYPTIGFTGFDGGKLKSLVKYPVHVPSCDMQICEDCHLIITHIILKLLK